MNPITNPIKRISFLIWSIVGFVPALIAAFAVDNTKADAAYSALPAAVIFYIVLLTIVTVRRLQDIGLSPWYAIFMYIPLASWLFWFYLVFAPSKPNIDKI